jgi:hypothetical protein
MVSTRAGSEDGAGPLTGADAFGGRRLPGSAAPPPSVVTGAAVGAGDGATAGGAAGAGAGAAVPGAERAGNKISGST